MNNKINFIPLKNLCVKIIDCPHSSPKWKKKGIPVIRNYNLKDGHIDFSNMSYVDEETYTKRIKRANPEYKDIVISREAPMGIAAIIPSNFKCCIGQRLVLLKVDKNICIPEYLLCAIQSQFVQAQIKIINKTGSVVSNLNISDLEQIVIPMMPMNEQSKIVEIYNSISDKIFNNNAILSELQSLAKTIYDYWFLQFDFPDENGNPYRSSGGKMTWNDDLQKEIPVGWNGVKLKDLASYSTERVSNKDLTNTTYIGTDNMLNNMNGITISRYIPFDGTSVSIKPGDILIANIRPYFKKIWLSDRNGGCNNDVLCIRSNSDDLINYLYASLATDAFFAYDTAGSKGSKMPRGDKTHIMNYPVSYNSFVAKAFNEIIGPFYKKINIILKENQQLVSLRTLLISLLLNGQVIIK